MLQKFLPSFRFRTERRRAGLPAFSAPGERAKGGARSAPQVRFVVVFFMKNVAKTPAVW